MMDDILMAHIKNVCKTCRGTQAVLWHSTSYDDKLHLNRLGAVTRLLDVVVGGVTNINGVFWRLHEGKQKGQAGIVVWLEKVKADQADPPTPPEQQGMIVKNRPKTAQEWRDWNIKRMEAKGLPLHRTPDNYPQNRPAYTMSLEGALEAEGRT